MVALRDNGGVANIYDQDFGGYLASLGALDPVKHFERHHTRQSRMTVNARALVYKAIKLLEDHSLVQKTADATRHTVWNLTPAGTQEIKDHDDPDVTIRWV